MFIVGTVSAPITADTRPFQTGLGTARRMGDNFIGQIENSVKLIGSSMAALGASFTKAITVPIAGASVAILKFGKDFESSMSKVVGLVGVSSDAVKEWEQDILKMAPEVSKTPNELADAMFFVTSAGLRGAEALSVLKSSARASAAGLGETKTIADLVTSAMNAYGTENLSAAKATDIITAAVREGKAEASELAASMGQVLPLASELGVTFDQVAATQASMTRTGTDAAEAATQLKSIMAGLIKPSKQAEEQLKAMGTSSSEMRKKIRDEGLLSALIDLREMTNKYGEEAMARVFPNIRALMGVLDLMGSNLEANKETFDKVTNSAGILDDAFEAASETTDFKFNQALSAIQATAIKFFDVLKSFLVPVLEKFVNVLTWVGDKFASLPMKQQQLIAGFSAIAAVIGPVLVVLGTVVTALGAGIGGLVTGITALSGIIATLGLPVLVALAAAIPILIGYISEMIAVISGLVAAFMHFYKTNEEFRTNVLNTWKLVKENAKIIFSEIKIIIATALQIIKRFWKSHGDEIMEIAKIIWNAVLGLVRVVMTRIKDIVKLVSGIMRNDWRDVWEAIKSILSSTVVNILKGINLFATLFTKIFIALVKAIGDLAWKMVKKIGDAIGTLASKGWEAGKNFLKGLAQTDFAQAGVKIVLGIISGMYKMFGQIKNVSRELAQHIRDFFPFSPAKTGPLKDLNKLNFAGPIKDSLDKASDLINKSFMGDILLNNVNASIPSGEANSGTTIGSNNFYGDIHLNGVEDMESFLNEMKDVVQSHTGRRLF